MKLNKLFAFVLASLIVSGAALATTSTVNPNYPAQKADISSAPLRANFLATYNDINSLWTAVGGISSTPPGGTNGQIQYNSSSHFGGFTMNGDCTVAVSTGVMTCTKTNGTSFGPIATLNIGNYLTSSGGYLAVGAFNSSTGLSSSLLANRFGHYLNVQDDCGVLYNGSNQSTALQACEQAALAANACMVFPAGTVVGSFIYDTNSCIMGQSGPIQQTIIQNPASHNASVLVSRNAASLWGTDSSAGVGNTYFSNFTVDGNRANNTTGNCIDLYGWSPIWDGVSVKNCPEYMVRSEWGDAGPTFGMEGYITNFKGDTSGKHGWYFYGPHDTQFVNTIIIDPSQTTNVTYDAFYLGKGNFIASGYHAWRRSGSNDMRYSFNDDAATTGQYTAATFTSSVFENVVHLTHDATNLISNSVILLPSTVTPSAAVVMAGSSNIINDVMIYCVNAGEKGFQIGSVAANSYANLVSGNTVSCTGGAIDFTYSGGTNSFNMTTYNSGVYPAPWAGTPNNTDYANLHGNGPNGGSIIYAGSNLTFPYGFSLKTFGSTINNKVIETGFELSNDFTKLYVSGNVAGETTPAMYLRSSGVSIGTTAPPINTLDVNGNESVGYIGTSVTGSNSLAVSGNIGIGTSNPLSALYISKAGSDQLQVHSTGANNSDIIINNVAGSQQSLLRLQDAGTDKWQILKASNNSFALYDAAAGNNPITIVTGAAIGLNRATTISGLLSVTGANVAIDYSKSIVINSATYPNLLGVAFVNSTDQTYIGTPGSTTAAVAQVWQANGLVGVGSTIPRSGFDLSQKTDAIILPVGTTGQRPSAVNGMLRYNSTLTSLEGYINSLWAMLLSGSAGTPTCGAGCSSITSGSTDARGSLTSGAAVSSITLNFSGTLSYTPNCVCGGSATTSLGCTSSTSALTITSLAAVTSDKVTWMCVQ